MTIGIEHVNDYPLIRFEIWFERKFPIRRSLVRSVYLSWEHHASCCPQKYDYAIYAAIPHTWRNLWTVKNVRRYYTKQTTPSSTTSWRGGVDQPPK